MSAKEEAPKEGEGEAKPKGKKKLFIIIGLVVLVAGIGVPMFLLKGSPEKKEGEEAAEEVKEEQELVIADLGQFVVNLSESSSFLKVKIKIEFDEAILTKLEHGAEGGGGGHGGGGAGGEGGEEGGLPPVFKKREPMIQDAVIRVLSSKKVEEVLTLEGKERLKDELLEAINDATGLEEPAVTGIYFSDFIVQ